MGDRTDCFLEIGGLVPDTVLHALHKDADETMMDGPPIEEGTELMPANSQVMFFFSEVNYGNLDSQIESLLLTHNIPFAFRWMAGGSYPAGIQMNDYAWRDDSRLAGQKLPKDASAPLHCQAIFATDGEEILLTLPEARDPLRVTQATLWDTFWSELRCTRANSAHDVSRARRQGHVREVDVAAFFAKG